MTTGDVHGDDGSEKYAAVGGSKAVVKTYQLTAADDILSIALQAVTGNPLLCGIRVQLVT